MSEQRIVKHNGKIILSHTLKELDTSIFENSTTLKVYLYLRSISHKPVGIRDTQRKLDFNSPGTAQWHLDKLRDVDIVRKLPSNKYQLTEQGKRISDISLPIEFPFKFIRGQLTPKSNLHLSFSITSALILMFVIISNQPVMFSLFLAQSFLMIHILFYMLGRVRLVKKLNRFIESK